MTSRKVAPLRFAQNANIVGRTLYRKNTAVEAIVLKKKYFNYIKEVQAAINENTPVIVALTKCLSTFYGTNDNDNNIDVATDKNKFTIKVFSTLLKTFASSKILLSKFLRVKKKITILLLVKKDLFKSLKKHSSAIKSIF